MTLRQYLARDRYNAYFLGIFVAYVAAAGTAVRWVARHAPDAGVPVIFCVIGLLYLTPHLFRLVLCPRCWKPLGQLAYLCVMQNSIATRMAPDRAKAAKRIERLGRCPRCSLRLDEEIGTRT